MLTSEVLPAPDGPNSAVTPPAASNLRGEREVAEPLFDVDGEHAQSPWKRMPARRANHSDAISAASAMHDRDDAPAAPRRRRRRASA